MAEAFSIEADFECSLDNLWSFVSHVPNQDHWIVGMSDSEVVGGGEIGIGSVIAGTSTERGKALRVTMVVNECDVPSRVSSENTDGHTPLVTEITCSGDETASRMKYEVTLVPKSMMMKVMMGSLRPLGSVVANKMPSDEIAHLRAAIAAMGQNS